MTERRQVAGKQKKATRKVPSGGRPPLGRPLAVASVPGGVVLIAIDAAGRIFSVKSPTGLEFDGRRFDVAVTTPSGKTYDLSRARAFRLAAAKEEYILSFVEDRPSGPVLIIASSGDLKNFKMKHALAGAGSAVFVSGGRGSSEEMLIFSRGGATLATKFSELKKKQPRVVEIMPLRRGSFDSGGIVPLAALDTERGTLLFYDASRTKGKSVELAVGAAVFSGDYPPLLLWRSSSPFWEGLFAGEQEANGIGAAVVGDSLIFYWTAEKASLIAATVPNPFVLPPARRLELKRFPRNPIIEPDPYAAFEAGGTFNPTALEHKGVVHILYRAVGSNGVSTIGYARSSDGLNVDERLSYPVYVPRETFEGRAAPARPGFDLSFASGGSFGGCEDPKLTYIEEDGLVYLTYVAHNGYSPQRVVVSSLPIENFLAKHFNWSFPVAMSDPRVVDKSACLLPEKINGKYVIFHRVFPDVLIDFTDDLNFGEGRWLKGEYTIPPRPFAWDSRKLSIGSPPIKTKHGWLTIYHAVDDRDPGRYKVGAMILDKKDPRRVLARSRYPILEPRASYENEGKAGIVYPGGAVVKGEELFVYYGGGDRVACVATAPLERFIFELLNEGKPRLSEAGVIVRR